MILEEKGGATPRGLLDIHSTVFEGDAVNALGVSGRMGGGWGGGGLCVVMYRRTDACGLSVSSGAMDTHSPTVRTRTGKDQYRDPYTQFEPKA